MLEKTMYYENNKHKECYLATYDAVKETIGKYYENSPLTLLQLCQILAPLCRTVIDDHIDDYAEFTKEDKKKAYAECMGIMVEMLSGPRIKNE